MVLLDTYGKYYWTYSLALWYIPAMKRDKSLKHCNLKKAGLFNPKPEQVGDNLFDAYPDFFDPCDNLQVRYEMLRSHIIEGGSVIGVCQRFGVSRQTFYSLQKRLTQEGTAGLLPKKSGPRGPSKLTATVLRFVEEQLEGKEQISTGELYVKIEQEFGVSLHKRTIDKLVKKLSLKKNS